MVKAMIVLVAFAMCVGFLNAASLTKEEAKAKWTEVANKCAEQTKASEAELEGILKKEVPTTKDGKCLVACIYKDLGAIKDGKYSIEGIKEQVTKIFDEGTPEHDKIINAATTCKEEVGEVEDECEFAAKIMECKHRLIGDIKHD